MPLPRAPIDLARRGAWSAETSHAPRVPDVAVAAHRRAQPISKAFSKGVTSARARVDAPPRGLRQSSRADHIACWTAFSGLLDDDAIGSADWAAKKKKPPASSAAVYDIAMFDEFTGSATMNSPAPNVAYQLTAAKAKAPKLLIDYEPLGPSSRSRPRSRARARGPPSASTTRSTTRTKGRWTTAATATARAAARSRFRTQKPVSCIRFVRLVAVPAPLQSFPNPSLRQHRFEREPNALNGPPPQGLRGRRFITQFELSLNCA